MRYLKAIMVVFLLALLVGCDWSPRNNIEFPYELAQPVDHIVSVEILYKQIQDRYDDVPSEVLKVLDSSEYTAFFDELSQLRGAEIIPPSSGYGNYFVRVIYQDQMVEVFGNRGSGYYYSDGRKTLRDYTFLDDEEYLAFLAKWLDTSEPLTEP